MNESKQFDADEIRRSISVLKPNNELFEVRIIKGKAITSGYFCEAETLIRELSKLDLRQCNVYFTLQQLHEGCAARLQYEHFMSVGRMNDIPTTSDNDAIGYHYIPIDLDPCRPKGISSNDQELHFAEEVRDSIVEYMEDQGYSDPIRGFSGNGYHLLYRINWPGNREPAKRVQAIINRLDELFSNEHCEVDKTVFSPGQIFKLYGTFAQKGRSTQDRPHRLSHLIGGAS